MIARLRGRVVEVSDDVVTLDVNGVGYAVQCHLRTAVSLPRDRSTEVTLHVHTSVSEDAIRLFGFTSREELRLFRLLINVERIGPKAALGILGRADLPTLVRALRDGDAAMVATVPGIGPKTAQRVVLELRDKLDGLLLPGDGSMAAGTPVQTVLRTAIEGLAGMGYRETEAREAVEAVVGELGEPADVAVLVAASLRRLDRAGAM